MTAALALAPRARPRLPRLAADPLLAGGALLCLALIAPTLVALALDPRLHLGQPIWIKPLKFEVSVAVYLATLALYAAWLPERTRAARWWRLFMGAVVAALLIEIAWIGLAASLGTASHFNRDGGTWEATYSVMGVLATFGLSASGVMAWHLARAPAEAAPAPLLRRAAALGLALTVPLTLVTAFTLSAGAGHEIGGDGVDLGGVPLLGWSRDGGDPRAAHFLATHAMQALPLAAVLLLWAAPRRAGTGVWIAAALYAAFTLAVFAEALAGRPFLSTLL